MKVKITPNSARFAATYDDYTFDVTCTDRQGRQYWREVHSKDLDAMDPLAQKVNKCGEIHAVALDRLRILHGDQITVGHHEMS